MKPVLKIFNKVITHNSPTLIIAEIGINHMGSEDLCKEMIIEALESGADCVKLQTGFVDECFDKETDSYEIFKNAQLDKDSLIRLKKIASDNNGYLFSSPGDFSSIRLLEEIKLDAYKISSGQFTNIPLIRELANIGKPMILSTGMASYEEIKKIYEMLTNLDFNNFAFLHTVSLYPADSAKLNLGFIKKMSKLFNVISGYSDHALGELACLSAIAAGAKIIEKHFTIDNSLPGADHRISMNPKDFRKMCFKIREIEKMFFASEIKPHPEELRLKNNRIRKIVAKTDLKQGDIIDLNKVKFIRVNKEEGYFSAYEWDNVVNKKIKNNIKKNQLINKNNIYLD